MSIWKITDDGPSAILETKPVKERVLEQHIEDWIEKEPQMLGEPLLIIGRQVTIPDVRDRIDLLAVDAQGNAVIIELKRGKLKDPVDMQALRYASYISSWSYDDFESQGRSYLEDKGHTDSNFNGAYEEFCRELGSDEAPDLNGDQRIILVGAEAKDKLGSVALWLRDHNIDIKVVEVEVYLEADSMFVQPQIIVPVPVSRFKPVGKRLGPAGRKPWLENGQAWHLDKRCSKQTKPLLLGLDETLRNLFDLEGPLWSQKYYVSYQLHGSIWLRVITQPKLLKLHFMVKNNQFDQELLAKRLGIEIFDSDESLSERLGLPSSVFVKEINDSRDRIILRVKEDFDLDRDSFITFLKEAYEHAA